jgi:hypothetical protein
MGNFLLQDIKKYYNVAVRDGIKERCERKNG